MWVLRYNIEEDQHPKDKGIWVTSFSGPMKWYDKHTEKWSEDIHPNHDMSSSFPCRSVTCFIDHLNKHPELQGQEMRLSSRWDEYIVYANWEED